MKKLIMMSALLSLGAVSMNEVQALSKQVKSSQKNPTKVEIVKPGTNISTHPDFKRYFLGLLDGKKMAQKKVLFIDSSSKVISPEDMDKYKAHNIEVKRQDCSTKMPNLKISKSFLGALFTSELRITKPFLCCSLASDLNKKIDIYSYKIIGCDKRFYFTSHPNRIAVLIDEKGNIISILDNVKNEEDVFKAFSI
ncbi:MAG: hypothetical protein NTZ68_00620 [Candidatus Dependentiae bacterium]|nr:hypothetical protein [Candidatus Dependentiae bacterium]